MEAYTTRVLDVVRDSNVALHRLLDIVAHSTGVPLLFVHLDQIPPRRVAEVPSDCVEGMRALFSAPRGLDGRNWWIETYQESNDTILPVGRAFEAPFLTLLRDYPLFYWWELATYARAVSERTMPSDGPSAEAQNTVQFGEFPGLFRDILTFGWIALKDLDAYLIFGPVPMRDRYELRGGDGCPVERFRDVAEEFAPTDGIDAGALHETLRPRAISPERLRRMFHFGGLFTRTAFKVAAQQAASAFLSSVHTWSGQPIQKIAERAQQISIVEAAGRAALLAERLKRDNRIGETPQSQERAAIDPLQDVEIDFPTSGVGSWRVTYHSDAQVIDIADHRPRADGVSELSLPAAVIRQGHSAGRNLSATLDDITFGIGNGATQDLLQQLAIGRSWLNDRFAQLSGATEAVAAASHEVRANADRICRWLLRIFNADLATIYQLVPQGDGRGMAALTTFGSARRQNAHAERWSTNNHIYMKEAEEDLSLRASSNCYRALWSLRLESVSDWDGAVGVHGLRAPNSVDDSSRPRATAAVPIKAFGRPWGILELVGFTPHQFDGIDPLWLEEFGALIGDPFFNISMHTQIYYINHQALWSRPPRPTDGTGEGSVWSNAERHRELMDQICERISRIFAADGAALWLDDQVWPGRFELAGLFGILEDPDRKAPRQSRWTAPHLDRGDEHSLSMRAIEDLLTFRRRREVIQEQAKRPPDEDPPDRDPHLMQYHRLQWESHVRYRAVLPLLVRGGRDDDRPEPLGTVVLFGKDCKCGFASSLSDEEAGTLHIAPWEFGEAWVPLMDFVGSQAAMLIQTLRLETHRQNQIELMFSHDVISKMDRIVSQFDYLERNVLTPFFKLPIEKQADLGFEEARIRLSVTAADRVHTQAQMAKDALQDMRASGFVLSANPNFRSGRPGADQRENVFDVLHDSINSQYEPMRRRNLPQPLILGDARDYYFIYEGFSPEDIRKILENLADNALKYSTTDRAVRVLTQRTPGQLAITFSNRGEPLERGESSKLFKRGFRGAAAFASNESGTGNGLYIAKTLAQQIGADLYYEPIVDQEKSKYVNHRFRLLISDREIESARESA